MRHVQITAFVLALTGLYGCMPSEKQWAAEVAVLQSSEKAVQKEYRLCLADWSDRNRKGAAAFLKTTEANAPRLACTRLIETKRSGRVTFQDSVDLKRNKHTPRLVKMLSGQ